MTDIRSRRKGMTMTQSRAATSKAPAVTLACLVAATACVDRGMLATSGGADGGSGSRDSGGAAHGDATIDEGGSEGGSGSTGRGVPDAGVVACSDLAPWTTAGGIPDTTLTVDAAQKGAPWSRFYERGVATDHANTILASAYPYGRSIQAALKKGHDQAGFQYARFHGILDSDIGVYTEDASGSPVYTWTKFDQVYDALQAAGMRPVFEVSFMPPALASCPPLTQNCPCPDGGPECPWLTHYYGGAPANSTPPKDWTKWQNLMAAIVTHLEGRYGPDEVRSNWYFEVWNESSWMYALGLAGYNVLYNNTVKGLIQGDPMIKVGGPAESGGGSQFAIGSLISYAKSNNLKLDFVSYHNYGEPSTSSVANAGPMLTFNQSNIMGTVKSRNFTGEVLNDEFAAAYDTNLCLDTEVSASFIAKTIHLIGTDPANPPPTMFAYWTLSDLYEENNVGIATAYHGGNQGNKGLLLKGDSRYPESFDVAKPAFNAFRLLHAMGDVRLAATGGAGATADGVDAAATIASDGSAIQILVYNHIDGGAGDPTTSKVVTLTVNNLPFPSGSVRVRQYLVDHTHSNSYTAWVGMGRPAQPSQTQWTQLSAASDLCYYETTVTPTGNSWTATFPLSAYSVGLIVLAP
jgi:xylan 1,4-beta-xylosidase